MYSESLYKTFKQLVQKVSEDYNNGVFVPILEADVVGYIYHLWVLHLGGANSIHLNTRLCVSPNEKSDLVVGSLDYSLKRPCISEPKLIIESKFFSVGFSDKQRKNRYRRVIKKDIPKLAKIKEPLEGRFILLFDENAYLIKLNKSYNIPRLYHIKHIRDKEDKLIKIIYMKRLANKLQWELM